MKFLQLKALQEVVRKWSGLNPNNHISWDGTKAKNQFQRFLTQTAEIRELVQLKSLAHWFKIAWGRE